MKSKIEVRVFAIEKAVTILGVGTSDKDLVSKAKEIEAYVVGDALLPDTYDETNAIGGLLGNVLSSTMETKSKK